MVIDSLNMLDPSKNRTADNLSALKTYNHEKGITCICHGSSDGPRHDRNLSRASTPAHFRATKKDARPTTFMVAADASFLTNNDSHAPTPERLATGG